MPSTAELAELRAEVASLREASLVGEVSTASLATALGFRPSCEGCGRRLVDEVGPMCWRCEADEVREN